MSKKTQILCVGRVLLDVIANYATSLPLLFRGRVIDEITLQPGGGAYFTGTCLKRLGAEVTIASRIGDDLAGRIVGEYLDPDPSSSNGNLIHQSKSLATSKSIVAHDRDGSARYLLFAGADTSLDRDFFDDLSAFVRSNRNAWIHIGNVNLLINDDGEKLRSWLKRIRAQNNEVTVSIDTDKVPEFAPRFRKLLPFTDYVFGNEVELRNSFDTNLLTEMSDQAFDEGLKRAFFAKLGRNGCYYATPNERDVNPGYSLRNLRVISENGSGDVFCGAAIACLVNGGTPSEAAEFANQVASLHVHDCLELEEPGSLTTDEIASYIDGCVRPNKINPNVPIWEFTRSNPDLAPDFKNAPNISEPNLNWWIDAIVKYGKLDRVPQPLILDAGCGRGQFAFPLAKRMERCRIIGVDRRDNMLQLAADQQDKLTRNLGIEWVNCELERLDSKLSDEFGKLDCVWMSSLLSHIKGEMEAVFRKLYRCLRPGGRLLIRDSPSELVEQAQWYKFFEDTHRVVRHRHSSLSEIVKVLHDAKFTIRRIELRKDTEKLASVEELIERYRDSNYTVFSLYGTNPDRLKKSSQNISRHFGDGPVVYEDLAYLFVAEKKT